MLSIKIALVCDHITQYGGAERVLHALHTMFPKAPIYALYTDQRVVQKHFPNADIRTTSLQKFPAVFRKKFRFIAPFAISAVENIDMSEFNVIISSSAFFAKGVITQPGTVHISYCHTPPRMLWGIDVNKSLLLAPALHFLRMWDFNSAFRVNTFIANSHAVQKRIQKCYQQHSQVVYPPVAKKPEHTLAQLDLQKQQLQHNIPSLFFLVVSSLHPYKKLDVVIDAFNKMKYTLVVIGDSPHKKALKKRAGDNVVLLGHQPEEIVAEYYKNCTALIHPTEEDFGISMAEAMLYGKPVLAFKHGGSAEIIQHNEHGMFFSDHDPFVFADTLRRFIEKIEQGHYNSADIQEHAQKFHGDNFKKQIRDIVKQEVVKMVN